MKKKRAPEGQAEARIAEAIVEEHRIIRRTLDEVHAILNAEPGAAARERALAGAGAVLGYLRDLLGHHFEVEEKHGLLEDLVACEPRLRSAVRELYDEHTDLRERIGAICRLVAPPHAAAGGDLERLRRDFEAFRLALLEHEEKENDFISEVYNMDIGGG
ncbi:MAG: hemerythrin domain-containing protein [Planctomycetes bacterium]|nr:hemerythrin domain-containing protein [Planctomycetota bacterium]